MAVLSRSRRAFWADVRFLVGIALVIISITGVWLIVSASDDAVPVLQANRTITEGEALSSSDFQIVEVGLGALAEGYLGPQELEPGQVAVRTLEKGEIVPASAAAAAAENRSTTIVVESSTGIPEDVTTGTVVEVWHAPPLDDGRSYDVPRILVADVTVRSVVESDGMLADKGTGIELVIDRSDVADVLAAVTGGSSLSVVPVRSGS
ncbi:SAF domain-containing protein [Microbacterium sp. EST19A]|uniref:SAF domain-containing protein n=1 Tax=Microbacterium sp. EST19A TaxID=2862681 RepID=UPI001CBEBC5D|nr:SAF domain-containing protein [Microbacterium sp. EST19A]